MKFSQKLQLNVIFMGVRADFFSFGPKFFPFSNPNPFPFEPKETKIREDNFSEMKEREESSSIFVVGERIYTLMINILSDLYSSVIHNWNCQLKPNFFPLRKYRVN